MKPRGKRRRGVYEAAGGLLWRKSSGTQELVIVHRARYDDWSLPKGTLEKGESWAEAALREVREETNCSARLGKFAGCIGYDIVGVPKIVLFWHMKLKKERAFQPNEEVDQLLWVTAEEAMERLSYPAEKALLKSRLG